MRCYPADASDKLGMESIRQQLLQYAIGEEARERIIELAPSYAAQALRSTLLQTNEFRQLLAEGDRLPVAGIPAVGLLLDKISLQGSYLEEEEAYKLWRWLQVVRKLQSFLQQRKDKYPHLGQLLAGQPFRLQLLAVFEQTLSAEGKVLSTASPALQRIRRHQVERAQQLRQLLERLLRQARDNGFTDSRELTIRNERLVLPIGADFKGRVQGVVHDVSQTGQTVYLEPLEALGLNNELRELRIQEQHEVVRILTALTDQVRPQLDEFWGYVHFITEIDFLHAKAQLALRLDAVMPALHTKGAVVLRLLQARHPLLMLQKNATQVVPLTLSLDAERRILVISGPNAGGKSVALKTVGLLQYMLQCGLLLPVHPDSELPLLNQLFVDIGDDQSIQNDLSTYTSHLAHMRYMLQHLDAHSMLLIDEFGTGTDPQLGGPIAEAVLEAMLPTGALGVITTHYSNIKDLAARHPHALNGAMQFDLGSLRPTYVLDVGTPGSSYALEMAARAGIPPVILARARELMGGNRAQMEQLLAQLQVQQAQLERLTEENRNKQAQLDAQLAHQRQQQQQAEQRRRELLAQAQEQAAALIRQANAKIEQTIREIREQQADKELTKQLRKELEEAYILPPEQEEATEAESETALAEQEGEPIAVGDTVRLRAGDAIGTVLELKGMRAVVAFGHLRSTAQVNDLVRMAPTQHGQQRSNTQALRRQSQARRSIDIRGMRVEVALPLVDAFVDEALLAGLDHVYILHGKGSGILRGAVRDHLQKYYTQVKGLQDATADEGGSGKTIVLLA